MPRLFWLWAAAASLTVAWFMWLITLSVVSAAPRESEYDRFERVCDEHGGFVVEMPSGFWTDRYDCIKDNEVIYLPGFAR